ncbi:hypothetical protein CEP54_002096 [Fusarium duplospermum]|uniref:Uncharacterized protein n=1 Tax=Fusarium duplospermum TaxID=1325734 RepID=A0A428QWF4_9HYPO|nr:hypothetical protein CEP54_002096 [Fusarium duplospermum]
MAQQVAQGPRSRQPLSSSVFCNDRLTAWLRDKVSPWSAAQSFETQAALHAHNFPCIVPPASPLLSGSTSASSCISDCSTQHRVPVPPPLGLSDPASLTGNTRRSTALLAGTGTWLTNGSPRPQKSPDAGYPEPPQLRPDRRLNASFRQIIFNNPDYAERLSRTIQDLSEDPNILLQQIFDSISSLGGAADSGQTSGSATSATQEPASSCAASKKRKTPPGGNQQRPGKTPNNSPGSGPGGGSTDGPSQVEEPNSGFRYQCPYHRVYPVMSLDHKFSSCQPPGHRKTRSQFKKHLKDVHVRTPGTRNSNLNPNYSMDEDLWNDKVVAIFKEAEAKKFTRGTKEWLRNEENCYQKLCKAILPNAQISKSPFDEDPVDGHSPADEAVQKGEVVSAKGSPVSQGEAMDTVAVALAQLFHKMPELSQRVNDLLRSQAESDRLSPSTEGTLPQTPATSSRGHVASVRQDLPLQESTAPQLSGATHQTPADAGQQGVQEFTGVPHNIRPETSRMTLPESTLNTATTNDLQQKKPASGPRMCIHFDIETPTFEITLKGRVTSHHLGPHKWEIPIPRGLVVEEYEQDKADEQDKIDKQRRAEPPINHGQQAMRESSQDILSVFDFSVLNTENDSVYVDGSWSAMDGNSSNPMGGGQDAFPGNTNY